MNRSSTIRHWLSHNYRDLAKVLSENIDKKERLSSATYTDETIQKCIKAARELAKIQNNESSDEAEMIEYILKAAGLVYEPVKQSNLIKVYTWSNRPIPSFNKIGYLINIMKTNGIVGLKCSETLFDAGCEFVYQLELDTSFPHSLTAEGTKLQFTWPERIDAEYFLHSAFQKLGFAYHNTEENCWFVFNMKMIKSWKRIFRHDIVRILKEQATFEESA